jgi:hypothetical protein
MGLQILHIGRDSIHYKNIYELFENEKPGNNICYAIKKESDPVYFLNPKSTRSTRGRDGFLALMKDLHSSNLIIVHGMTAIGAIAFGMASRNTIKFWSGWGYDYYGSALNPNDNLLLPMTEELIKNTKSIKISARSLSDYFKYILTSALSNYASSKADFFSAPVPSDFDIFRKRYSRSNAKYKQLNYGNISQVFSGYDLDSSSNNILLGNSASPSNNHLDAFDFLSKYNLNGKKVIVPLSYGDEDYKNKILEVGRRVLGDSFQPLTEHMDFEAYIKIINSCNIVFMNHIRQQAIGNIGAALYHGAHLILDQNNPVYEFLKKRGAHIYNTDDMAGMILPAGRIDQELMMKNRCVLEDFWGDDVVKNNIKIIIDSVLNKNLA